MSSLFLRKILDRALPQDTPVICIVISNRIMVNQSSPGPLKLLTAYDYSPRRFATFILNILTGSLASANTLYPDQTAPKGQLHMEK